MYNTVNVFYSEYGRYISRFRAIPYYADCLKPVERRLLLVLYQESKYNFVKSARIIGNTIAKYHPHGDKACYDSMVKLVHQGFASNEGGGFGNQGIKDKPAAHMRYTETKLMPWVSDLCMEYINFVPYETLELDPEPLYLPSPIPIGLIGDGISGGVAFHKTVIPKYKAQDLFKRLKWLLENGKPKSLKAKDLGPKIIPFKSDCKVEEFNKNDFYKILLKGEGEIVYIPRGKITTETIKRGKRQLTIDVIKIEGRAPDATFNTLVKDVDSGKLNIETPLDLSNNKIEVCIIPSNYDEDLSSLSKDLWANYLSKKINFNCFVCDKEGKVEKKGIDELILTSYTLWKEAWLNKLKKDISLINNKLFDNEILSQIRNIVKIKKVKLIEDVLSNFNYTIPIIERTYISGKWKSNKIIPTEKDVIKTCSNSNIQQLVEHKDQKMKLTEKFNNIQTQIDNISDLAYKRICNY